MFVFIVQDDSTLGSFDDMKNYCREYIANSTASKKCSSVLNAPNFDARIENCARDMNVRLKHINFNAK